MLKISFFIEEEKSHVPEYFSKIFESINEQAQPTFLDKIPDFFKNFFSSETKAKIVGRVEFNGQHFDIVEYGGGGDCCFRSFANTNEFIDGKSISNFVDLIRFWHSSNTMNIPRHSCE